MNELLIALAILAGLTVLYGCHRLFLWLEREEWICYLHRRPSGGGGGSLLELQKFLEPKVERVVEVKEQRKKQVEDGSPP